MNFCPNCGTQINGTNPKFCSGCGSSLTYNLSETQIISTSLKSNRINKKKLTAIAVIISVLIIVLSIVFLFLKNPFDTNLESASKSEVILNKSVDLLGTSCDYILRDNTFTFSESMGIIIAKKTTNDIFGVEGENVIFILPDDEYVTIVTWESSDETVLTEEQIETFIKGMEKTYGKCNDDSDDNSYLWETNTCIINLQIDEEDNSLTILFCSN